MEKHTKMDIGEAYMMTVLTVFMIPMTMVRVACEGMMWNIIAATIQTMMHSRIANLAMIA